MKLVQAICCPILTYQVPVFSVVVDQASYTNITWHMSWPIVFAQLVSLRVYICLDSF